MDPKTASLARYGKDYAECKAFADADPSTNTDAAVKKKAKRWGLGTAAIIGVSALATGGVALIPMVAADAALSGGVAAASGGYTAKTEADEHYRSIIVSCLTGRGYSVLN